MKVNNCTICNHALVCPRHGTLGMEIPLNQKISDLAGCNVEGRVSYAVKLIEEGDVEGAKSELNELLEYIKGE